MKSRSCSGPFIRLSLLAGAAIAASFAPASAQIDASKKPFVMGVVLPMSGPYGQFGLVAERALKVGAKQVNDAGGIMNRKVEILFRDDAGNPGRNQLAVKELQEDQKVDILYPSVNSVLTLAALPYATERKILTVSGATAAQIGDVSKFPYSFQYSDVASEAAPPMAAAIKKLGGQKVGILVSTNPATIVVGDILNDIVPRLYGMTVVGYQKFEASTKDLTPQLQALRDAGADIIAFDGAATDSVRVVMTGMQNLAWKAKVVGEARVLNGDLTQSVPPAVHDQFFSVNYRAGTRVNGKVPSYMQPIIDELKTHGPINLLAYSTTQRDLVFLLKWAFETTAKKGPINSDTLRATLESTGQTELPKDMVIIPNPRYSATDHTTKNADYSKMWSLIKVSKDIDGTYEGEDLEVPHR